MSRNEQVQHILQKIEKAQQIEQNKKEEFKDIKLAIKNIQMTHNLLDIASKNIQNEKQPEITVDSVDSDQGG